ncbi:MAG TPA: hypothetical protein VML75_13185 [Kofleriaceae bacterium]|nr:hypothetical protein [Kofleriaceae bacterium]
MTPACERVAALGAVLAGAVACGGMQSRTLLSNDAVVYILDTETDEVVSVVEEPGLEEHEPTPVSRIFVSRAMMASSFFQDEDIDEIAEPIALTLEEMEPGERIRIVAWQGDGARLYYLHIRNGKLRMVFRRGANIIATYEAKVPAEVVAIAEPVVDEPPGGSPPATDPAPDPGEPAGSDTRTAVAENDSEPKQRKRRVIKQRKVSTQPKLSEGEARTKLSQLQSMLERELITRVEYRDKRREVLERL